MNSCYQSPVFLKLHVTLHVSCSESCWDRCIDLPVQNKCPSSALTSPQVLQHHAEVAQNLDFNFGDEEADGDLTGGVDETLKECLLLF